MNIIIHIIEQLKMKSTDVKDNAYINKEVNDILIKKLMIRVLNLKLVIM